MEWAVTSVVCNGSQWTDEMHASDDDACVGVNGGVAGSYRTVYIRLTLLVRCTDVTSSTAAVCFMSMSSAQHLTYTST